jgi:uncharacterized protein YbjT (DUF2867 family)
MILVTGATGYIGGRLIPRLAALGYPVRALARDPRRLGRLAELTHGVVSADLLQPHTLASAVEGADTAYYLAHSMTTSGGDFAAKDRAAARNFAAACTAARVRRIIYLGGLGNSNQPLSSHLASRQEVGAVLATGPVPVTELRAAIIVGAGSASFEIIRDLVHRLPVMITPRWVRSRCEPIAIAQVLDYLVGVLEEPRSVGQVLDIGGGEVLTYEQMMRECATVMGRRLRILTLPVLTPSLSAYWLNLVTSVPMSLARPLVEGLRNDVVTTDRRIRDWIPTRDIPYREAVATALAEDAAGGLATRWTLADTSPPGAVQPGWPPPLRETRTCETRAPAAAVFAAVQRIGGETGWYYADWLWRLRGAVDRMLGGVGMRRGRAHPTALTIGQPVDFWRVADLVPGRLLRLRAEMKLPGVAELEFAVEDKAGGGARLRQRAQFQPNGFWGRLYWYLLLPFHAFIFGGMAQRIVAAAERGS